MKVPKNIRLRIKWSHGDGKYREGDDGDSMIGSTELEILEKDQIVGKAKFYILYIDEAIEHGVRVFDLCDAHSQETYNCGAVVFEDYKYDYDFSPKIYKLFGGDLPFWTMDILSIERIEIDPGFRGRGIGLCAILKIMRRRGKHCAIAIIKPFPLQWEGNVTSATQKQFEKDRAKLIKHYAPLGFKNVPRTEFYAFSLLDDIPTEYEVLNAVSSRASKSVNNPTSARPNRRGKMGM